MVQIENRFAHELICEGETILAAAEERERKERPQ